jgi:hypothetical protein
MSCPIGNTLFTFQIYVFYSARGLAYLHICRDVRKRQDAEERSVRRHMNHYEVKKQMEDEQRWASCESVSVRYLKC